jgi:carbonic anhydrase
LGEGYRRFRATRFAGERERWQRLGAGGQRPTTMVVACSDDRSAPETVFDAAPGELFVVRNVAALVPRYEPDTRSHAASAALEYAVLARGVEAIVVMGHAGCGGVTTAAGDVPPLSATDFLGTWVADIRDLVAAEPGADRATIERRTVVRSVDRLATFPWLRARVDAGAVTLHGAWFDIATGELHVRARDAWVRLADA